MKQGMHCCTMQLQYDAIQFTTVAISGWHTIVSPKLHTSERESYLTVSPGMESIRSGCRGGGDATHNISARVNQLICHQLTLSNHRLAVCVGG